MHDCIRFLFVKCSPGGGNGVSKGRGMAYSGMLALLAGSEAVRNGAQARGASAVEKRAGRGYDPES